MEGLSESRSARRSNIFPDYWLKVVIFRIKVKMENEVCLYQKYGFCKFKESCLKRHLKDKCKDLNRCKIKKNCEKRHPKLCRRYVLDQNYSYGEDCEYLHEDKEKFQEENKLKKKWRN